QPVGVVAAVMVLPGTGRKLRPVADPRGGGREAEPRRARDRGLSGRGIGEIGSSRADLQVEGKRQKTTADQPERRVPTNGSEAISGECGLPACHAGRERQRADAQRRATAPGVALAVITVRLAVVPADRDAGAAL